MNEEVETASKVINGQFFRILEEQNAKRWVFLAVAETIVGSLLFGGVCNVQCLFNLLYYVIWFATTRNYPKSGSHFVSF